ncbi:MAG: hypothetical protein ACK5KL_06035 [Dysgonomonas sp.]
MNKILIEKILKNIPSKMTPVDYLSNTLNLSKMSAYRRIRNEIDFSFEDIYKLSRDLDFSIDEIFKSTKGKYAIFEIQARLDSTPKEIYLAMFEKYRILTLKQYNAKNTGAIVSMNRPLIVFLIAFENLFKFTYYKWIHQMHEVPIDFYFSEVSIPLEIETICTDLKKYTPYLGNNVFIIDSNVFYNIMMDILYYYNRGLINKEEFALLKSDLSNLIDTTQRLVLRGCNDVNSKYDYYLSQLPIEANSSYTWYDDLSESFFYSSHANPIGINEKEACLTHKRWLESIKKYSSLITQSNEETQSKFFKKQREYLDEIFK